MIGEKKEAAKKGKKLELDNEELVAELNGLFKDAMTVESDLSLMKTVQHKGRKHDNDSGERRVRSGP